jgi:outer membrane biosynthesis protein TonB
MSIRNTLLVLLFGGTLGVFLMREQERGTMEPFDRVHREFLKANPAPDQPAGQLEESGIVLARLDDVDQINRVFSSWPLAESDWQVILQNVPGYSPKATAVAAPMPFRKAGAGLESAIQSVPRFSSSVPASTAAMDGSTTLPEGFPVLAVKGDAGKVPAFTSIRPPALPGSCAAGDIDLLPAAEKLSVDGDWCRVPMLARMGDEVVPTLALRALLDWAGEKPESVTVQPGIAITAGKTLRIPIDEAGFFRYYLSLAPEVPTVNADVFVLTKERAMSDLPPGDPQRRVIESLPSRLLWLGHDDTASRRLKLPNGTPVSPASLTARAIAAIQTARFLHPLSPALQWIAPGATLLFCLWLTHWRKSRLWPGAFVAAVALIGISLWLYRRDHHWMPLGPSLAILTASVLLSHILPGPGRKASAQPAPTSTSASRRSASRTLSTPAPAAPASEPLAKTPIPEPVTVEPEPEPPAEAPAPEPEPEQASEPAEKPVTTAEPAVDSAIPRPAAQSQARSKKHRKRKRK